MAHAQKATDAAPSSEGPAETAVALMHSTDAVADAVKLLQKKPADASDHETTAVVDAAGEARAAADGAAVPAHCTVARADATDAEHDTTAVVDAAGQARADAEGAAVPAHHPVARADASDAEQTTIAVSVGAFGVSETFVVCAGAADQAPPKFSLSAATIQAHGATAPPTALTDAAPIKSLLPHATTSAALLASAPTERTSPTAFFLSR